MHVALKSFKNIFEQKLKFLLILTIVNRKVEDEFLQKRIKVNLKVLKELLNEKP